MKIRIHNMPFASSDAGVFHLSYGIENPYCPSMWDVINTTPEGEKWHSEYKKSFPDRWLVRLHYQLANGPHDLIKFSESFLTQEQLVKAFETGLMVEEPDNKVIKLALDAYLKSGAITLVDESVTAKKG